MNAQPTSMQANSVRIVRHDAFTHAVAEMQGQKLLKYDPQARTLTIGPGTPTQTRITLSGDGTVSADNPLSMSIPLAYTRSNSVFENTRYHLERTAAKLLTARTLELMDLEDQPLQGGDRPPYAEIRSAARSAVGTLGNGFVRDAGRLGLHALRSLIGTARISETLRYVGVHAVLRDLNTVLRHQQLLQRAHALSPNALLWWTRNLRPEDPDPRWRISPQELYQQAKEHFQAEYAALPAHLPWHPKSGSEEAWNAYVHLSASCINHHPPMPGVHTLLAGAVADAGVQPSYTLLTALFRTPKEDLRHQPSHLIHALIAESARRAAGRGRGSQKQLAATYHELNYGPHVHPASARVRDLQDRPVPPDFSEWETLIPAENPPPHPRPSSRNRERDKPHTKNTVREAVYGPLRDRFIRAVHGNLTVETDPGRSVILRLRRTGAAAIAFRRRPDGTITLQADGEHHWQEGTQLPGPDPDRPVRHAPSTQGLVRQEQHLAMLALTKELQQQGRLPLNSRTTPYKSALRIIEETPEDFGNPDTDTTVTRRLRRAIATLMDPEAAELCLQLTGHVPLPLYNSVLLRPKVWSSLADANPAAAAWSALRGAFQLTEALPSPPPDHPGQVVAWARKDLADHGLPSSLWRRAVKLRPRTVQAAWKSRDPHWTARLMAAVADSGQDLAQNRVEALRPFLSAWYADPEKQHYITRLAVAAARDASPEQLTDLLPDEPELSDYLNAMDGLPASRTLGGLRKASARWHRDLDQQLIQAQWDQKLVGTGGAYQAWNSLVNSYEQEGYVFTALTDEAQLTAEALAMNHCVSGYGPRCADASSRVFRISREGRHLGTAELFHQAPGDWIPSQVNGPRNHPMDPGAHAAAQQLALEYSKAEAQARPACHTNWILHTEVPANPTPYPSHTRRPVFIEDLQDNGPAQENPL